ncbi:MAG: 4-alpha-glucanotransferase [Cyanobacteria bacterium NC_groundwater_1444_Ag_S-0.65um_54_12]|nr:4-alpha-glucanotransferase [Cyanobacteria bacterium NC_groundwater_1444_Ag_S-0.65um_54_12]
MKFSRASGLLFHPTALPGPYGIGDIGPPAHSFVDFLAASSQRLWQVLPLGPTGYGDSPYQCLSAFAGNPLLLSPELLFEAGLLPEAALDDYPALANDAVAYEQVIPAKYSLLQRSFAHFEAHASPGQRENFERFRRARGHQSWLPDFTLFMAIKKDQEGKCWVDWPPPLRDRDSEALTHARKVLAAEIHFQEYLQYLFFKQWAGLRQHAMQNRIRLLGDVPIFVAYDSADVWGNRQLFKLDDSGQPLVVAGVPPDYFSKTGQLWGNPLYDWEKHAETRYAWWIERIRVALTLVDYLRLDHFRGFEAYWAVPAGDETAVNGQWLPGPGAALFEALRNELGTLPIVAEDLGEITPPVEALREQLGLPGMKVLQFAFDGKATNGFLPHNHPRHALVYTGTHDNDTSVGWYHSLSADSRKQLSSYAAQEIEDPAWTLIRLAMGSVADMAIVPLQDILSCGTEARMNMPGRAAGNWSWRLSATALKVESAERLRDLTLLYGRA